MSNKKTVNREYLEKLVLEMRRFGSHALLERDFTQIGGTLGVAEPLFQNGMVALKKGDIKRFEKSMEAVKEVGTAQGAIATTILSWAGLTIGGLGAAIPTKLAGTSLEAALSTPLGKALAYTAMTYFPQEISEPGYWGEVLKVTKNYMKTFKTQVFRGLAGGRRKQSLNNIKFGNLGKHERAIKTFYSLYGKEDIKKLNCKAEHSSIVGKCRNSETSACFTHRQPTDEVLSLFGEPLRRAFIKDFSENSKKQNQTTYVPLQSDYLNIYSKLKETQKTSLQNLGTNWSGIINPGLASQMAELAEKLSFGGTYVSWDAYALLCFSFVHDNMKTTPSSGESGFSDSLSYLYDTYPLSSKNIDEPVYEGLNEKIADQGMSDLPLKTDIKFPSVVAKINVVAALEGIKMSAMNLLFDKQDFARAFEMFMLLTKVDPSGEIISMDEFSECVEQLKKMQSASAQEYKSSVESSDAAKYGTDKEVIAAIIITGPESILLNKAVDSLFKVGQMVRNSMAPVVGPGAAAAANARTPLALFLVWGAVIACFFLDPLNIYERRKILKLIAETKAKIKAEKNKRSSETSWRLDPESSADIMGSYYKGLELLIEELMERVDLTWGKSTSESSEICETLKERLAIVKKAEEISGYIKETLGLMNETELVINSENVERILVELDNSEEQISATFDAYKTPETTLMAREGKRDNVDYLNRYLERNEKILGKDNIKIVEFFDTPEEKTKKVLESLFGSINVAEVHKSFRRLSRRELQYDSIPAHSEQLEKILLEAIKPMKSTNHSEELAVLRANFKSEGASFILDDKNSSPSRIDNALGVLFAGHYKGIHVGRNNVKLVGIPAAAGIDGMNSTSNAWGPMFLDLSDGNTNFEFEYKQMTGIEDLTLDHQRDSDIATGSKSKKSLGRLLKLYAKTAKTQKNSKLHGGESKILEKIRRINLENKATLIPNFEEFFENLNKLKELERDAKITGSVSRELETLRGTFRPGAVASLKDPKNIELANEFSKFAVLCFNVESKFLEKKEIATSNYDQILKSQGRELPHVDPKRGLGIIHKHYNGNDKAQKQRKKSAIIAQEVFSSNKDTIEILSALMGKTMYGIRDFLDIDSALYRGLGR